jgi:hypothetical protein
VACDSSNGGRGAFCSACRKGFVEWKCVCGCVNPFKESWFKGFEEQQQASNRLGWSIFFAVWALTTAIFCSQAENTFLGFIVGTVSSFLLTLMIGSILNLFGIKI